MKRVFTGRMLQLILICTLSVFAMGNFSPGNAASAPDSTMKPLAECLDQLQPALVFKDFYQLTRVPRPTHHEEKATAFLATFGRSLNLETITDDVGNVIIRKPATPGYENRLGVVLQAHTDMVPQKTPDKAHDFLKDPVTGLVKDNWLTADRTTLGADDGIGVAMIMALLQDKGIAHGPVEALFTVGEEEGLVGANGLKPGVLRGDLLINIDSEEEGIYTIGSAGGAFVDAVAKYREEPVPKGMLMYLVSIKGLKGGHSGVDINKGLGNAAKLMVRLLWSAGEFGVRVVSIEGGDRYNAIPRESSAVVAVPAGKSAAFEKYIAAFGKDVKAELSAVEPGLGVSAVQVKRSGKVMNTKSQSAMLDAVYGCINGVQRMSDSVPGLVETSSSMGIFKVGNGQWTAGMYPRSAKDSARDDVSDQIAAVMRLAGADVKIREPFSGWPPNVKSRLLALMKDVYREKFGKDAQVIAIHAGLETSVIGVKYPNMEMISVGPSLQNVHTPDEQLDIPSVAKVYDLLVETLKRIPAKAP